MDLAGIDAFGEMGDADPETAAALIAFCRGDGPVSADEQAAVARLITGDVPDWIWPDLARMADRMGHELASAVCEAGPPEAADRCAVRCAVLSLHDPRLTPPARPLPAEARRSLVPEAGAALGATRGLAGLVDVVRTVHAVGVPVPEEEVARLAGGLVRAGGDGLAEAIGRAPFDWRETLIAAVVAGLEQAPVRVRRDLLTGEICRLLAGRDWTGAPAVGVDVLHEQVRSGRLTRAEATELLLGFAAGPQAEEERDAMLEELWRDPPTVAECSRLLETAGPRLAVSACLNDLPTQAFLHAELTSGEVVRLAERVRATLEGYPAEDAEAVLIVSRLPGAARPAGAAADVARLIALTREGNELLTARLRTTAAARLAPANPGFRAAVVGILPEEARMWLTSAWLDRRIDRDEQLALVEVAIRLRLDGLVVPRWTSGPGRRSAAGPLRIGGVALQARQRARGRAEGAGRSQTAAAVRAG
nr:hypothetical protein GCM10020093_111510 [Planobispora longispora]